MSNPALQSHLRYPLTRLLGGSGNVRVLRALLTYAAPLSAAQVAKDAGLTPQGTRRVLENLVAQGFVTVLGQARSQVFSVVKEHPFALDLQALFEHEQTRWAALRHSLRSVFRDHGDVRSAWLYGSVARGEDAPHSDIDIAVVMDDPHAGATEPLREAIMRLEDSMLLHVSLVSLAPADVARLSRGDPWWSELSRDAQVLIGVSPQEEAVRCAQQYQPT